MLTIHGSSSHIRLANENVSKYVNIPDCSIIACTLYKNCFQYAGAALTQLINENAAIERLVANDALSVARSLLIVALKIFLTIPAVSVPGLILCIAKFIDEHKWCCSYTDQAKNM